MNKMIRYEIRLTQYQLQEIQNHPENGNVCEQIRNAINNYLFKKESERLRSQYSTSPSKK